MSAGSARWSAALCWLLAAVMPLCGQQDVAQQPAVVAIGITVRDLDASLRFYTEVLHCRLLDRTEREGDSEEHLQGLFGVRIEAATLALGDERLELVEFVTPRGRSLPEDSRSNDRWFQHVAIIVRDMDRAYAELRRHDVQHASPRPQTLPDWNPQAGGIRAFYFRDPDGHPLELLQFPAGKGDAKWHRPGEELFLGIDHTAIVVADTDASLRFWCDQLGFRVAGHSDNYGIEQERLNNVFGARLRITALRGSAGVGVELLEYVTPRTGRSMPADSAANDLWQTVVKLHIDGLQSRQDGFARAGALVSARPIVNGTASAQQLFVRDPDGHRALLTEVAPVESSASSGLRK